MRYIESALVYHMTNRQTFKHSRISKFKAAVLFGAAISILSGGLTCPRFNSAFASEAAVSDSSRVSEPIELRNFGRQDTDKLAAALDLQSIEVIAKRWSEAEREAVNLYTDEGYGALNRILRTGQLRDNQSFLISVCHMDSAIFKGTISGPLVLFRGHNFLPEKANEPGYEFTDPAFVSTSLSMETAELFAHRAGKPRVVDIVSFSTESVPGIWIDPVAHYRNSDREFEVLLARNLRFRVVSAQMRSGTLYRQLKIVGETPSDKWIASSCQSIYSVSMSPCRSGNIHP
ncbi:MAG: ADP-ribosyltransferase [Oligoflexia bacterium]|nr:ADP-ribosyltransferase [Oligoflexia bacterium]